MKHLLSLMVTTAIIGVASAGYAADVKADMKFNAKENGGYESQGSSSHTTAAGTVKTSDRDIDVDVDADGNVSKTVKTESVSDAKGLMNKQKSTNEVTTEKNADGSYKKEAVSTHSDADGTNIKTETDSKVDMDAHGNALTTTTVKKTVDPKGLMNATTETAKIKMKNGVVIEKTTDK